MWLTAGKMVSKVYGLLWMTAVGGILGANLSTTIGMMLFVSENKAAQIQPWTNYGWWAGIAIFFVGAIFGKLRFINGSGPDEKPKDSVDNDEDSDAATAKPFTPATEQSSSFSFIAVCGLAGSFLGLLLGGSLLVFLFSYAYSPFASQQAASSITIVSEKSPNTAQPRSVMQTNHPSAFYVCLTPAILGLVAGVAAGGVITAVYGRSDSADTSEMEA